MAGKLLTLTKAKTEAEKALAAAGEIADPKKRASALVKAGAALAKATEVLAGYKFKKTIKVEEEDDSDDDDDDKDDDDAEESEKSEEDAEDEGEEAKSEEDEDAEEDADDMPAKKGKKASASASVPRFTKRFGAESLLRVAAEATGETDIEAICGALSAMKGQHAALMADVAKIKADARKTKVLAMVDTAIKQGRVSRAEKASLIEAGMKSPKWLAANISKRPAQYRTSVEGGEGLDQPAATEAGHIDTHGLSAKQRAMIEASAKARGVPFEQAFSDIKAEEKKLKANGLNGMVS